MVLQLEVYLDLLSDWFRHWNQILVMQSFPPSRHSNNRQSLVYDDQSLHRLILILLQIFSSPNYVTLLTSTCPVGKSRCLRAIYSVRWTISNQFRRYTIQLAAGESSSGPWTVEIQETTVLRVSPEGKLGRDLLSDCRSTMIKQAKHTKVIKKLKSSNCQKSDLNHDPKLPTGPRRFLVGERAILESLTCGSLSLQIWILSLEPFSFEPWFSLTGRETSLSSKSLAGVETTGREAVAIEIAGESRRRKWRIFEFNLGIGICLDRHDPYLYCGKWEERDMFRFIR